MITIKYAKLVGVKADFVKGVIRIGFDFKLDNETLAMRDDLADIVIDEATVELTIEVKVRQGKLQEQIAAAGEAAAKAAGERAKTGVPPEAGEDNAVRMNGEPDQIADPLDLAEIAQSVTLIDLETHETPTQIGPIVEHLNRQAEVG